MGQAGGLKRLPLLLFGLGIALVVDLQGLLLYNISNKGGVDKEMRRCQQFIKVQ
jgi:hypothetical protein